MLVVQACNRMQCSCGQQNAAHAHRQRKNLFQLHRALRLQWLTDAAFSGRYIQSTCATSGEGLYEGLDWLSSNIANKA